VQEEGHLPISFFSSRRDQMGDSPVDSSEPEKPDRPPVMRVMIWSVIALALIVGIVLFFRYSRLMSVQL